MLQLATDPKLAFKKAKELWGTLSLPEPENQARPATLEQLLVLLTRESARRIVHLVNGTTTLAARTPRNLGRLLIGVSHQLLVVADATFRVIVNKFVHHSILEIFITTVPSFIYVYSASFCSEDDANYR